MDDASPQLTLISNVLNRPFKLPIEHFDLWNCSNCSFPSAIVSGVDGPHV